MIGRAIVAAPAKVNLLLRVLRRRDDGFHDIDTLFQAISVADEVRVEVVDEGPSVGEVRLTVDGPDLGPTEQNLAFRAAERLLAATGRPVGISLALTKRIPAGGGLGGGSSDAAAVLRGLAELLDLRDVGLLRSIGAELGSDVPFFLSGSPLARGQGRGEVLTTLEPLPEAHLVLAFPPVHVATGAAYGALAASRGHAEGGVPDAPVPPSWSGAPEWEEIIRIAHNDFEEIVADAHPQIGASLRALRRWGADLAMLSGSGAACFALMPGRVEADEAARACTLELGWPFRVARTLRALPAPRIERG